MYFRMAKKPKKIVDKVQDHRHQLDPKKVVLKFRSVNSIVIPAAKTGKDNNNKKAVINTDQTNKGKEM